MHSLWARAFRALMVTAALLLLAAMAFGFLVADSFLGATAYLWFWLAAASSSFGVGWLGRQFLRSRLVWIAGVVLACGVVILRFVDISPVKPFCRFYFELRPGQSKASVLEDLARHFPADGRFDRPIVDRGSTDQVLTLTLDPHDGSYDSEYIYVYLEDGKVTRKVYEGD